MKLLVLGKQGQLAQCVRDECMNHATIDVTFIPKEDIEVSLSYFEKLLRNIKPDVVINCMAYTDVEGAEDNFDDANLINHLLPKYVAEATHALEMPFLHISTDYVFDGSKDAPYTVLDPKSPLSVYGKTKSDGEDAILASTNIAWILRTSWVYSIYGKNFFKTMIALLQNKDQLSIISDQCGAPTSAHQLAQQIVRIISEKNIIPYGVHHAVAAGETTWYDFAKEIQKLLNTNGLSSPTKISAINAIDYPTKAKRPQNSRLISEHITMATWSKELMSVFKNYITSNGATKI
jgi:dTDP-4-dehydrorhamnose reductase